MFTANTMAVVMAALGLSLHHTVSHCATTKESLHTVNPLKLGDCRDAVESLLNLCHKKITARSILTLKALENAATVVQALGGSTNACLHLMAIAREAAVTEFSLETFHRVGLTTPLLANMAPHGTFHMSDLDAVGGCQILLKELLDGGLLQGDCMTVHGVTLAESLADVPSLSALTNNNVIRSLSDPHSTAGKHISVLKGNICDSCVIKLSGKTMRTFTGKAVAFDSEKAAFDAIVNKAISKTDNVVLVIR